MTSFNHKVKELANLGADIIVNCVGTWKFAILYTVFMVAWVYLHNEGFLTIDNLDFNKYNLFLSWFAGTQASIVLMAANGQSANDRRRWNNDHEQNTRKLLELIEQIEDLEETLDQLLNEDNSHA